LKDNLAEKNADDTDLYGRYADVIVVVEKKEFQAHRIFLERISSYESLFQSNSDLKSSDKIKITSHIQEYVFSYLLSYLYTDEIHCQFKEAMGLLPIAHQLQLPRLLQMCELILPEEVTINNVTDVLQLATKCNAHYLKQFCLEFIGSRFKEVEQTSQWQKLSSAEISTIVDYYMSLKFKD